MESRKSRTLCRMRSILSLASLTGKSCNVKTVPSLSPALSVPPDGGAATAAVRTVPSRRRLDGTLLFPQLHEHFIKDPSALMAFIGTNASALGIDEKAVVQWF